MHLAWLALLLPQVLATLACSIVELHWEPLSRLLRLTGSLLLLRLRNLLPLLACATVNRVDRSTLLAPELLALALLLVNGPSLLVMRHLTCPLHLPTRNLQPTLVVRCLLATLC